MDTLAAARPRAAIEETNALRGRDAVVVPAGTYTLSHGAPPTGATLTIMDDLELIGADAASTVIDGAGLYRIASSEITLATSVRRSSTSTAPTRFGILA
jgi:hypothetical protein